MKSSDIDQLKDLYKKLVINVPKNLNQRLCVFFPQIGKNYFDLDDKLLFIGKSVNGWVTDDLDVEKLFDCKNPDRIVGRDDEIVWVEKSKNPKYYNSNNSAFWRLVKSIAKKYLEKEDWYNNIVWSNMYKISPWDGGNPNAKLRKMQSKICVDILNKEIEIFNPKFIIFLTSYWETFYLKSIGYNNSENKFIKWDKYETRYQLFNGRIYILSQHPQGKKELPHKNAIINIMKNNI